MLLADRYADRSHFIYEILQNAEDALRQIHSPESRSIKFTIEENALIISHFGKPFDEKDIIGICGIALSTKSEINAIGRFGIGFKSVYTFTKCPQVHSGDEDFKIENYVWPVKTDKIQKSTPKLLLLFLLRKPT